MLGSVVRVICLTLLITSLAACGGINFGGGRGSTVQNSAQPIDPIFDPTTDDDGVERDTIFDLFANNPDPNVTVEVNKYIWRASLEVLNFMPIESVDPFSGVIVMGFGTPPGGRQSYRATVFVQDPALDARSLRVALATRGGPAPADTTRAVEDAILTRARQLRIAEGRL